MSFAKEANLIVERVILRLTNVIRGFWIRLRKLRTIGPFLAMKKITNATIVPQGSTQSVGKNASGSSAETT